MKYSLIDWNIKIRTCNIRIFLWKIKYFYPLLFFISKHSIINFFIPLSTNTRNDKLDKNNFHNRLHKIFQYPLLTSITSFSFEFHLNRIQNEETYSTLIVSRLTQLFLPLRSRKNRSPTSELNTIVSARQETIWSHKRVLAFVPVKSHADVPGRW